MLNLLTGHKRSLDVSTIWQGKTKFFSVLMLAWGMSKVSPQDSGFNTSIVYKMLYLGKKRWTAIVTSSDFISSQA